jgi:iron complex transport system permease protein
MLSLLIVVAIAKRQGSVNVQTLLLGGVVVGAMLSGLTILNLYLANLDSGRVLWWLLGSTTSMTWDRVVILLVTLAVGGFVLHRQSRPLNAFSVSEFMAERQGVETGKLKWVVLVTGAAMTGVAVGTVGIVGFVGLLGPHIARRVVGNDLRGVMPASVFFGSTLLLASDLLAQRLKPGLELPLGAVTAVLGAPALLWLLKQKG